MRAGCFAEPRVIRLLNRRFVSFYYNPGGPGLGKDPAAAAFTRGKTKNTYAFYAAFDASGQTIHGSKTILHARMRIAMVGFDQKSLP